MMVCRGVRGATTVEQDCAALIVEATCELLECMVAINEIAVDDVASILFTVTSDLTSCFPARAARELGWKHVPLIDAQEIPVPGSLGRCIRVLLHWNTDRTQAQIQHIYLRGAASLRPDLVNRSL